MTGTTDAVIDGPTSLTVPAVTLTATRTGWIVSLTAGVSGASGVGGTAVAGSVGVSNASWTTETAIRNTSGTVSGPIMLTAKDAANIILVSGSAAFGGKTGVGAAVAFSRIANTVSSTLTDLALDFTGSPAIGLTASASALIVAVAASAGVGTTSGGGIGTAAVNMIANPVTAAIRRLTTRSGKAGSVGLTATDTSASYAVSGAVGVGSKGGIGAAVAVNSLANTITAAVESSTLPLSGTFSARSSEAGTAVTIVIAAGISAQGFSGAGSVAVNVLDNTIDTHLRNSSVGATGNAVLAATDSATSVALAGGLALAGGSAAVGAAVAVNFLGNSTTATVEGSTLTAGGTGATATIGASGAEVLITEAIGATRRREVRARRLHRHQHRREHRARRGREDRRPALQPERHRRRRDLAHRLRLLQAIRERVQRQHHHLSALDLGLALERGERFRIVALDDSLRMPTLSALLVGTRSVMRSFSKRSTYSSSFAPAISWLWSSTTRPTPCLG